MEDDSHGRRAKEDERNTDMVEDRMEEKGNSG